MSFSKHAVIMTAAALETSRLFHHGGDTSKELVCTKNGACQEHKRHAYTTSVRFVSDGRYRNVS